MGPFAFFDVKGSEELSDDAQSLVNTLEAEMVMEVFTALVTRYPELKGRSNSIAVISPYKAQASNMASPKALLLLPYAPVFFLLSFLHCSHSLASCSVTHICRSYITKEISRACFDGTRGWSAFMIRCFAGQSAEEKFQRGTG